MKYPRPNRLIKQIQLVILAILLTGCAGQVRFLEPLTPDSKLVNKKGEQHGLIVARVINASNYPHPFNQLTVTPDNLNESSKNKPLRMSSKQGLDTGTTVFSATIGPGDYSLSDIRSYYHLGDYYFDKFVFADTKFGTFSIEPGKVTDLGTLIYYTQPDGDRYKDVLFRLPADSIELGTTLNNQFPFFEYDNNSVLTWHNDDFDEERSAYFAYAAQNPIQFHKRYKGKDGNLYFLGHLGAVLTYRNDNQFELGGVERNFKLNAIAQNEAHDLVMADSEGNVYLKPTQGDWQDLEFQSGYNIHELEFIDEQTLMVLASKEKHLYIYKLTISEKPTIQTINQFKFSTGWKNKIYSETKSKKVSRLPAGDKFIVSAHTFELDGQKYLKVNGKANMHNIEIGDYSVSRTYSVDTATWRGSAKHLRQDFKLVLNAGAKELGIEQAGFWSLSGQPSFYLPDNDTGEWTRITNRLYGCRYGELVNYKFCKLSDKRVAALSTKFNLVSVPHFKDQNTGVAIATLDSAKKIGLGDINNKVILHTRDGGEHWTYTDYQLPKQYCSQLVPEISDRLLLSCNGATTDFYESLDDGKTWQHVRQQEVK